MVSKIICDYLRHDKRITVPGFGSFIRKEDGQIAFVDILRGDDGVLSSLVRQKRDYTEVEAAAVIDRFIFEIKHALQTSGSIHIKGLGTMSVKTGGKIDFRSDIQPQAASAAKPAAPGAVAPAQRTSVKTAAAPKPATASVRKPANKPVRRPVDNKKRIDTLLIAAIVMAAIALSVMIYGFSVSGAPELRLIP